MSAQIPSALLLPASVWWVYKTYGPMCSACPVQLWSNLSEEASPHGLMSLRTNYWVSCINSPWSASSVLSFWAQTRLSRQEELQRTACRSKGWCRWLSGFISDSLKRQKYPQWSFGVKIYSLLIKTGEKEKKAPFLGQIIDSGLPSNVKEMFPSRQGIQAKRLFNTFWLILHLE